MNLYNAPEEIVSRTTSSVVNESGSLCSFEQAKPPIWVANSFVLFVQEEIEVVDLIKKLSVMGIPSLVFDSSARLTVRLLEHGVHQNKVFLVGLQEFFPGEFQCLRANNVLVYPMKEISLEGKEDVCNAVMSVVKDAVRFHVHIDESVLNAVGLAPRELVYFLHRLRLLKGEKSVSICPRTENRDVQFKIIKELF